jgi:hypothetical protein
MSLKRRFSTLLASMPAKECCLTFEHARTYSDAVFKRFDQGPMLEAPPGFLPTCLKGPTPCPQGHRYGCGVWRNVARLEHLRNSPAELLE